MYALFVYPVHIVCMWQHSHLVCSEAHPWGADRPCSGVRRPLHSRLLAAPLPARCCATHLWSDPFLLSSCTFYTAHTHQQYHSCQPRTCAHHTVRAFAAVSHPSPTGLPCAPASTGLLYCRITQAGSSNFCSWNVIAGGGECLLCVSFFGNSLRGWEHLMLMGAVFSSGLPPSLLASVHSRLSTEGLPSSHSFWKGQVLPVWLEDRWFIEQAWRKNITGLLLPPVGKKYAEIGFRPTQCCVNAS